MLCTLKLRFHIYLGNQVSHPLKNYVLSCVVCWFSCSFCPLTYIYLISEKFPEVYTGSKAPAAFGARDLERGLATPVYRYGWVVSRAELYEALNGEPCRYDRHLYRIYVGASRRFYSRWTEKGYEINEYRWVPIVSSLLPLISSKPQHSICQGVWP